MEYELDPNFVNGILCVKIDITTFNKSPHLYSSAFWTDIVSRIVKSECTKLYNELIQCNYGLAFRCKMAIMGIKVINSDNFTFAKNKLQHLEFTYFDADTMIEFCDTSDIGKLFCLGTFSPSVLDYIKNNNENFYMALKTYMDKH